MKKIKILLSEGSSISSRQALSVFGQAGYHIELCSYEFITMSRFSRYTKKIHKVPRPNLFPAEYIESLLKIVKKNKFDLLIPVQEETFLLARYADKFQNYTNLPIASFESMDQLQSKVKFALLLEKLHIPSPNTQIVSSLKELKAAAMPGYYIKTEYSTASSGLFKIRGNSLDSIYEDMDVDDYFKKGGRLIVQQPIDGYFEMLAAVFDHGLLKGIHIARRLQEGYKGGATSKFGINRSDVVAYVQKLGKHLNWHGYLALEYLYDPEKSQPLFIDSNPRAVELYTASLNDVDLGKIIVDVALGKKDTDTFLKQSAEKKTHMLMFYLFKIANEKESKKMLWQEFWNWLKGSDHYEDSMEELHPFTNDWPSIISLLYILLGLTWNINWSKNLVKKNIEKYSFRLEQIQAIKKMNT